MNRALGGFFIALSFHLIADEVKESSYPPIPTRNGRSLKPGADLNVDYLYWTAREDGLQFAYDGSAVSGSNASPGQLYGPNDVWQSGYKVGLAAYTGYDGWDLLTEYTWYKISTQAHINEATNLKPIWKITNFTPTTITAAINNWSVNFNALDILLRRQFFLSPKFLIQTGIGLKATWQKQTYITTYDNNNQSGTMQIDQKTNGLGICAALTSNWYITEPVSIVGKVAVSNMWLTASSNRLDMYENSSSDQFYTSLNTKQNLSYVAPVIETFLGFSFERPIYKKKFLAVFTVGYEMQVWFDTNQFISTILDTVGSYGNLNLQGLTARGQIEF
jgi:hypothetical protein